MTTESPNPRLNAALRRIKQGFKVFPCQPKGKTPIVSGGRNNGSKNADEVREFWRNNIPAANYGIVTGIESDLFVVDVDGKEGKASLSRLTRQHGKLPKTQRVITPNNGMHLYFRYPKDGRQVRNSASKIMPGIDIRGDGGYVVGAGSSLEAGKYRYAEERAPKDVKIADAPGWLLDLVAVHETAPPKPETSERQQMPDDKALIYAAGALQSEIAKLRQAPEKTRNHALNSSAFSLGQLIAAGVLDEENVRAELEKVAHEIGLEAKEITKTIESGVSTGKDKPRQLQIDKPAAQQIITSNSDIPYVISQMLLERYAGGEHLLYSASLYFYRYVGTHWQKTEDNIIKSEILNIVTDFFKDPSPVAKKQSFNTVKNEAFELLKSLRVDKEDKLGKAEPLPIVNCQNGEIWTNDDGTWELRPHGPSSYQTHCLKVNYDPYAKCPRYKKALKEIFRDSKFPNAMSRHFNELAGYIIQPRRHIPKIFFFKGEGDNGKGVLAETLQRLMGEDAVYSCQNIAELAKSRFGIGDLFGKLLLIDDDVDKNTKLPDGFLKKISERKPITGEVKFKNTFKFICLSVPLLLCNNEPSIADVTHGMRRRLMVLPFDRIFTADEKKKRVFEYIWANEMSGILNETLKGMQRLLARGDFDIPKPVINASAQLFEDGNSLVNFINECCVRDINGRVTISKLYEKFKKWAEEAGITRIVQRNKFGQSVKHLGYKVKHTNTGTTVFGLSTEIPDTYYSMTD